MRWLRAQKSLVDTAGHQRTARFRGVFQQSISQADSNAEGAEHPPDLDQSWNEWTIMGRQEVEQLCI